MYTTQPLVEARLGAQLTDEQASYFNGVLDKGIDAYIDRQTETTFGSEESTDIYVDDENSATIIIPTMHDITAMAYVGPDGTETVIPPAEYYAYPRGKNEKYAVRRWYGLWTGYYPWRRVLNAQYLNMYGAYKITGVLGYKGIPADIKAIATELAVNDLKANINNYKRERVGDWDVIYADAVQLSDRSQTTLEGYKRASRTF